MMDIDLLWFENEMEEEPYLTLVDQDWGNRY